jgi:hypothetical protein
MLEKGRAQLRSKFGASWEQTEAARQLETLARHTEQQAAHLRAVCALQREGEAATLRLRTQARLPIPSSGHKQA